MGAGRRDHPPAEVPLQRRRLLQRKVAKAYGVEVIESAEYLDPEQYRALIDPEAAAAKAEAEVVAEAERLLRRVATTT